MSLFCCFFSNLFLHLRLCFSPKIQNFLWSIFWRRNYVFIFRTLPLSVLNIVCFSSLRRHFSLFVLCFLFLWFFIVTFLDFLLSIFFLGFFKKIVLFCRKKVQTYHSSFNVFFLKISCISLFLSHKKKTLQNDWFSLLFLFTSSSWFVLSSCVLSLCLLSLLLLFQLTKNSW